MQWKGEVPEHDVDDNPNAVASVPTAPPLEKMDTVAGYGNVGFDSGKYTEILKKCNTFFPSYLSKVGLSRYAISVSRYIAISCKHIAIIPQYIVPKYQGTFWVKMKRILT